MVGLTVAYVVMLEAGQVMATNRAVGHQLAALLLPGHLRLAAAAPVSSAAAIDNIEPVRNASPALNPAVHPPAAGIAAIFDAWAETQNMQESERLRADLTADTDRDRGELLAPHIG